MVEAALLRCARRPSLVNRVLVLVVMSGRTITITITITITTTTQTLTALRYVRDSNAAVTHLLVSPSPVILG